jgi:hypothetical protein
MTSAPTSTGTRSVDSKPGGKRASTILAGRFAAEPAMVDPATGPAATPGRSGSRDDEIAGYAGFLTVRYERRPDIHRAFLRLGCALISFKFVETLC